jgi:hypothetical protein
MGKKTVGKLFTADRGQGKCPARPVTLYKYCSARSALRILEEMRLKVALPNECNDLFEFTPRSKVLLTRASMLQKVRDEPEHFRPTYENLVADGYTGAFDKFMHDLPGQIEKKFPEVLRLYKLQLVENDLNSRDLASRFAGILCLSETSTSAPMWAHYAHDHSGAVVGLCISKKTFPYGIYSKIRYCKHRVPVAPNAPVGDKLFKAQIHRTVFRKNVEWKYEQEHRVLFNLRHLSRSALPKGKTGYFVDIWSDSIQSVTFGGLMLPPLQRKIRKLLHSKPMFQHIRQFQAVRHPKKFTLETRMISHFENVA